MDLFELSATLGLDTSSYETGLGNVLKGAGKFALELGKKLASWTVDFGKDVIKTGMGFDEQMSAVQAVLGEAEGTEENMLRLRAFALEQARESIFTSEETAQAYYYMGMAGWKSEQMLAGLPGIMNLAAASGEDLKTVSDMVTDSLTAFGLGAGQASHFADVLAQTATNANTDVARMQKTFQYLAPIAGQLGYSIEDVALSVGLVADSGIKGSMAGTTLRNVWTRIATNAGSTKKDLGALEVVTRELGVAFFDAAGRARPWGEVLEEMREAWNKLNPKRVDLVTKAFGDFVSEGQDAQDVMAEFAEDLDVWTTQWNSLTTEAERNNFVRELAPQFEALGISFYDSSGKLREFNQVAQDARVMLGGLSDEQAIYYAKQVGSLRGISGFLSLMTATQEDFDSLKNSINGARGAAEAMAGVRLDNLAGDVKLFNASLDVLRIAIFDDVKAPLREVVQWASTALNDITDAINEGGLIAGIEMFGTKLEEAAEKFMPLLESIGKSAAPIIVSLIETTLPQLEDAVMNLGRNLASGLLSGFSDELSNKNPIISGIAGVLSSFLYGGIGSAGSLTGDNLNPFNIPVEPTVESEQLQAAIDVAVAAGAPTVTIGGIEFSTDYTAAQILDAMKEGGWDVKIEDAVESILGDVAASEGLKKVSTALGETGDEGGDAMAKNINQKIADSVPDLKNILTNGLSGAGPSAGNSIAGSIQKALNMTSFAVKVTGFVSSLVQGFKTQKNASAMASGRIFKRPTVFGFADGAYQVAGDAGPEAVVGVNSLSRMIEKAVSNGMSGQEFVVPRGAGNSGKVQPIIFQIDGRNFAQIELPYLEAEQQRRGVKLTATGGAH